MAMVWKENEIYGTRKQGHQHWHVATQHTFRMTNEYVMIEGVARWPLADQVVRSRVLQPWHLLLCQWRVELRCHTLGDVFLRRTTLRRHERSWRKFHWFVNVRSTFLSCQQKKAMIKNETASRKINCIFLTILVIRYSKFKRWFILIVKIVM